MTADAAAIVAARNEAESIAETVKALWRVPGVGRVVVVDDASTDATAELAVGAGAEVIGSEAARSKGRALDAGLGHVDAPWYLLVDGDTGATAEGAAPVLAAVMGGEADLAIGRLPRATGGGFGLIKGMTARLIRMACGFETAEPMSGQRAATREVLRGCRPLAPGFAVDAAMTVDAVRLGYRVVEIDVEMSHRPTGRSVAGFAHRGRQGLHVLGAMIPRLVRLR
jgi:glycosyltransferase involved in cell wall biosynthesis